MIETSMEQKVEELFKEEKYQEISLLLTDELLEQSNSAVLYAYKARVLARMGHNDTCLFYAQKSIDIDSTLAVGYIARGNAMYHLKNYHQALDDYNTAINIDEDNAYAYFNRALVLSNQEKYDLALDDYNKSIELNINNPAAYISRGNLLYRQKKYNQALADYNKVIHLDENNTEALLCRGNVFLQQKKYKKAVEDYNKAIVINENYANAYYNRAIVYGTLGEYNKSIKDYIRYIELKNNSTDYSTKVAQSQIERFKRKISNKWYEDIDLLIKQIKQLLIFDNNCLTHYTSLSAAKEMILKGSPFRLSEGTFLNDTSEGRELFKFLAFEISNSNNEETIAEIFLEKPFIGSFVAESKHNDLTLWRMYGKEEQTEAKGCAITINKEQFIKKLESKVIPFEDDTSSISNDEERFRFYKVAYKTKDKFFIPENTDEENKSLNELLIN